MALLKPNIAKLSKNNDIDGLIAALQHKENTIRDQAIIELGNVGGSAAIPHLVKLVQPTEDLQMLVLETFWNLAVKNTTKDMLEPLIQALEIPLPLIQQPAAIGLGKIQDKKAIGPLITLLESSMFACRDTAADVLGSFKDESVIKPLLIAVGDEDESVSDTARNALLKLEKLWSYDLFITGLESKSYQIQTFSIDALSKIGDEKAVTPIINKLIKINYKEDPPEILGDLMVDYYSAVEAIQNFGTPAVPQLIELIQNSDDQLCLFGVESLKEIPDTRALEPLINLMGHSEKDIRESAIIALGNIKGTKAIPAIIKALDDKDRDIRIAASKALCQIGDPRGILQLEKENLNDEARRMKFALLSNIDNIFQEIQKEMKLYENKLAKGEIVHHEIESLYIRQTMLNELLKNADTMHNDIHLKLEEIIKRLNKIESSSKVVIKGDMVQSKADMRDSITINRKRLRQ